MQSFARVRFDHDFFQDQAMVRRIKRARQAQAQQDMEMDDDDADGEDDIVVRGQKVASGRAPKKEEEDD